MPQNNRTKTDSRAAEVQELQQTVADLKTILKNLSTVVTQLEKTISKHIISDDEDGFESAEDDWEDTRVSVFRRVQSFQGQGRYQPKEKFITLKKRNSTSVVPTKLQGKKEKALKDKSVLGESANKTVVNSTKIQRKTNVATIENIKKKFETSERNEPEVNNIDQNAIDQTNAVVNEQEVKVNVQSLKQKFEAERKENSNRRVSAEPKKNYEQKESEARRISEGSKVDELNMPEEYAEKVKRILKYFQPQSR